MEVEYEDESIEFVVDEDEDEEEEEWGNKVIEWFLCVVYPVELLLLLFDECKDDLVVVSADKPRNDDLINRLVLSWRQFKLNPCSIDDSDKNLIIHNTVR